MASPDERRRCRRVGKAAIRARVVPTRVIMPRTNRSNLLDMLIERDGAVCRACGTTADLTIDHALPVSLGGKWEMSNLQLLCSACNGAKGNKHIWFPVRKEGTNE